MEEAGGTSEPQQAQQDPTDDGPPSDAASRGLIVVGVLLIVALVGVIAWVVGGDDVVQTVERADGRFPSADTVATTEVPADPGSTVTVDGGAAGSTSPPTAAPTAPATVPPTAPPTDPPTTPPTDPPTVSSTDAPTTVSLPTAPAVPGSSEVSTTTSPVVVGPSIDELVPSVAGFAEPLTTPASVRDQIAQLLASPRHDVASAAGVAALCAVVPLTGPIEVAGRWERNGHQVMSSDPATRSAPGYGECVGNGADLLDDGSYQYIATDSDGRESAAAGFVVGAARIDQAFVNNGDEAVCAILIAPRSSSYFEAYVFDTDPVGPKGEVTLPLADVSQDVETTSCAGGDVLASFHFVPDPDQIQELDP